MADTVAGSSPKVRALFLGPTRIQYDGGDPFEISNLQARLLAQLAIAAPAPLTTEQLLDALWPDDRPANARASLYNQVSRLRAKVGVDVVQSVAGAYSLAVPTDIDEMSQALLDIERLLHIGAADTAERRAEEAVRLWRGTPLPELPADDARAGVIRRRTAETLRSLCTLRVQAALGAGHTAWAVPEAERLVGETPHDERRWALLVDVLCAAGRRGDAFAAFERARRELADSLGLEPGKVLTAAHDRLLMPAEHDVRSPSTLVGRDGFIAEVLARLDERPSTLLYGEHGIGKSRLIAVIGNRLARSGSLVANVTATRHPTHAAQVIYEIAEALGKTIDPSLPPTHGLVRVLHELVDGGNRVAILIDDAANLGPASTIAISAATRIERVSVIVTSRTRLELLADSDVLRLEIPPLNETQIAPIVESRLGSPPSPELLSWIWSMSGGNPALVELLTSQPLDQFPPPDGDDSEMGRLFDGLLRIHTAPLSEEGVNTLEVVAVLGTATRSVVLEFVSENGLDEAIVNGLLDQSDKGLIEFRHGALRSALYQAMAPGRRAEYHAFVLRVLERLKASADRIAPHAVACRDLDPLGAARILVRAAARGITAVPARRAEPWFRLALSMAEPLGDAALPVTAAAQIGLAEQLRRMGHPDQRAAAEKAVRLSLSSERPALIAEACSIAARVYGVGADGTVDPAVADLVRHALDVAENDDQVAAVLIGCSKLPPGPALERAGRRAALDALDMTLSPTLQRRTRLTAGRVLSSPADLEIRTLLAEEERDQTSPEYILGFEQRLFELPPLLMRCQGAVAAERAKALEVGVSGAIDLDARLSFGLYSAMLSYLRDDLDEAERTIRTLDELAEVAPTSLAPARKLANLLAIRLAQGRESELLEEIAEHASRQPEVHLWSALHARCLVSTDPHRALTLALRASEESTDHPLWALTAALCGAVGVETANAELAQRTIDRLGEWTGQFICSAGVSGGLVDAALAGASLVLGRFGRAAEFMTLARGQMRALQAPALTRDLDRLAERITMTLLQHGAAGAG